MTTPLPSAYDSNLFEEQLRAVGVWGRRNRGKLPRLSRENPVESQVCMWLASQTRRAAHLTPSEVVLLNRTFPQWRKVRLEPFDIRLHEVGVFLDRKGHLPSPESEDEEESRLGSWLARKASRARDSTILLRESSALDSSLPGWRGARCDHDARVIPITRARPARRDVAPRKTWDDRLSELRELVESAHRPPVKGLPEEQSLAKWLMEQQSSIRHGRIDYTRIHRLLLILTDNPAITFRPSEEQFSDMLDRLRDVVSGQQLPIQTRLVSFSDHEMRSWSEAANILFYRGELTDDQVSNLDSLLSDWRDYRRV